jgi:hypothetical protein
MVAQGEMGSAPQNVVVVKGQIVLPAVVATPLGPGVEIVVNPHTATLKIGGVTVGTGGWKGRLPLGAHELHAYEAGYHDHSHDVGIGRTSGGKVHIDLEVDEDHERWGVVDSEIGAAGALTFIGYGIGVAGIVVGSIFGTMTMSDQEDLATDCQNACDQEDIDKLTTRAHVSTGSFIAAGAGLTLGTVAMILWLSEDDATEEAAGVTVRPYALGGLALEGRF